MPDPAAQVFNRQFMGDATVLGDALGPLRAMQEAHRRDARAKTAAAKLKAEEEKQMTLPALNMNGSAYFQPEVDANAARVAEEARLLYKTKPLSEAKMAVQALVNDHNGLAQRAADNGALIDKSIAEARGKNLDEGKVRAGLDQVLAVPEGGSRVSARAFDPQHLATFDQNPDYFDTNAVVDKFLADLASKEQVEYTKAARPGQAGLSRSGESNIFEYDAKGLPVMTRNAEGREVRKIKNIGLLENAAMNDPQMAALLRRQLETQAQPAGDALMRQRVVPGGAPATFTDDMVDYSANNTAFNDAFQQLGPRPGDDNPAAVQQWEAQVNQLVDRQKADRLQLYSTARDQYLKANPAGNEADMDAQLAALNGQTDPNTPHQRQALADLLRPYGTDKQTTRELSPMAVPKASGSGSGGAKYKQNDPNQGGWAAYGLSSATNNSQAGGASVWSSLEPKKTNLNTGKDEPYTATGVRIKNLIVEEPGAKPVMLTNNTRPLDLKFGSIMHVLRLPNGNILKPHLPEATATPEATERWYQQAKRDFPQAVPDWVVAATPIKGDNPLTSEDDLVEQMRKADRLKSSGVRPEAERRAAAKKILAQENATYYIPYGDGTSQQARDLNNATQNFYAKSFKTRKAVDDDVKNRIWANASKPRKSSGVDFGATPQPARTAKPAAKAPVKKAGAKPSGVKWN